MRIPCLIVATVLTALTLATGVRADDVGITTARLYELGEGRYAIEADVSSNLVSALAPPVLPARFEVVSRADYQPAGAWIVVRYEFSTEQEPLGPQDSILLPWGRSAVLLTARWIDGETHRAMFSRSPAGIRVSVSSLRVDSLPKGTFTLESVSLGLRHVLFGLSHWLFLFSLALFHPIRNALRLAVAFAAGHVLAMFLAEIGSMALPLELSESVLAVGVVLLIRDAVQGRNSSLELLALALGITDGLGLASLVAGPGIGSANLSAALLGSFLVVNTVQIACIALIGLGTARLRATRLVRPLGAVVAGVAVAVAATAFVDGLHSANRAEDLADYDQIAAARFDLNASSTPNLGSPSRPNVTAPRSLDDPAILFLTVEPAEVRIEVLLRLADFVGPLRIEGTPRSTVAVDVQSEINKRAMRLLSRRLSVQIDDTVVAPTVERADFVSVGATGVTTWTEPQPQILEETVIGLTYTFEPVQSPSRVNVRWTGLPEHIESVPAVWAEPGAGGRSVFTPELPEISWEGELSDVFSTSVSAVAVEPPRWPVPSLALFGLALLTWFWLAKRGLLWRTLAWTSVVAGVLLYPFVRPPISLAVAGQMVPSEAETARIIEGMLTNVYRSFELRGEEAVYERLSFSVTGDQLTEVYLENRRALELENRGGARARVNDVEVLEIGERVREGSGDYRALATWTVAGSVSHFGHVHFRQNRYDAYIRFVAQDGTWKIREIEILSERREY